MQITREQALFIQSLTPEQLESHISLIEKRERIAHFVSSNSTLLNDKIVSGEADDSLDSIESHLNEIMVNFTIDNNEGL